MEKKKIEDMVSRKKALMTVLLVALVVGGLLYFIGRNIGAIEIAKECTAYIANKCTCLV